MGARIASGAVYNAAWQLVEERIDADYTGSGGAGTDSIAELFWGIRYIDDLMLRRVDESAGGTTFKRWHPLTDAQFSVRAVLRDDAGVHERINYSPYGVAEHHWGGDVDNDRSADFFDWLALGNQIGLGSVGIGQANYVAEMDLNRDGVLDSNDSNAIGSGTALPSGWISAAGAGNPGNVIGFDGYVFNAEIETYSVRFRWYDPELGRWLQRDVLEYPDGMNRYQQSMSNPTSYIDPWGLNPESPQWHHELPQSIFEKINSPVDHNDKKYGRIFQPGDHSYDAVHRQWNKEWRDWVAKKELRGEPITKRAVEAKLNAMRCKPDYKDWVDKGVPADISYDDWDKKSSDEKEACRRSLRKEQASAREGPRCRQRRTRGTRRRSGFRAPCSCFLHSRPLLYGQEHGRKHSRRLPSGGVGYHRIGNGGGRGCT